MEMDGRMGGIESDPGAVSGHGIYPDRLSGRTGRGGLQRVEDGRGGALVSASFSALARKSSISLK